jgi:hypothetical protein
MNFILLEEGAMRALSLVLHKRRGSRSIAGSDR